MRVRRRSEPVEAVQWHKPGDHPAGREYRGQSGDDVPTYWIDSQQVRSASWLVYDERRDASGYRVLTPEQFAAEYERVG